MKFEIRRTAGYYHIAITEDSATIQLCLDQKEANELAEELAEAAYQLKEEE